MDRNHARLGKLHYAWRSRPGHDLADGFERVLGCVHHQVARAATVDNTFQDRSKLPGSVVWSPASNQNGLRGKQRGNGAKAVGAKSVSARHEIDDCVRKPESGRDFNRSVDVDEAHLDVLVCEQISSKPRIGRGHAQTNQIAQGATRGLFRNGHLHAASAKAEFKQHRHVGGALADQVCTGYAAIDDAVLDVLWDIGGAHEKDVDRGLRTGKRKRALTRLLGPETGVLEERDRRRAQPSL